MATDSVTEESARLVKKIIPKGPEPVIKCAYTKLVPLKELKPHPYNANEHSEEQIEYFVLILGEQGIRRPATRSKRSGYITRGHGLIEAIRRKGWSKCPIDDQDYDSEAQEIADVIADNELARLGMLNRKKLDIAALALPKGFDLRLLAIPAFCLPPPFKPGNIDDQGKLDEKTGIAQTLLKCPNCQHEFTTT